MPLLFNDILQASDTSGLYTLMAFVNGTWTDIHTMAGTQNGDIPVNTSINTIPVNNGLLPGGQTFQFKWMDSIGNESNIVSLEIPSDFSITAYSSGTGKIDFINTGGDNYNISFYQDPISIYPVGTTTVSYAVNVNFFAGGVQTPVNNNTYSADYSFAVNNLGAGVYAMQCDYSFSDNLGLTIYRLVSVDNAGNILADIQLNGITISNIHGLTATAKAEILQTGVNYPIQIFSYNKISGAITLIGSGNPATVSVPAGAYAILMVPVLDPVFNDSGINQLVFTGAQVILS
jgi:hypothetical protein